MKNFFAHVRTYIFRGLLAIIPILLCYLAIQLLYVLIDKRVMTFIESLIDIRQIPGLGLVLVLIFLYFLGLIVSNVVGREIFKGIESLSERIPLIKAIYAVGKQVSDSLSNEGDKKAFQRAVLVDCFNTKGWTIGFVTGTIKDINSTEEYLKVFVPTVPNPTTGFVFIVNPAQTIDPGWTVEEALKMIVSAGIISPDQFRK